MKFIDIFHLFIAVSLFTVLVYTGFFLIDIFEEWLRNKLKNRWKK